MMNGTKTITPNSQIKVPKLTTQKQKGKSTDSLQNRLPPNQNTSAIDVIIHKSNDGKLYFFKSNYY